MTTSLLLAIYIICIISITKINSKTFRNSVCFESIPTNDKLNGYGLSISLFGSNYTKPPIDDFKSIGINSTCSSSIYPNITDPCFECSFNIDNFTEDERYRLLYAINENLDTLFLNELEITIGQNITWIKYAEADQIAPNSNCDSLSYPRFCDLSLSNTTGEKSIVNQFLLSMGLDIISNTVKFRIGCDTDQWFGIGISYNQSNPLPMEGYGLIFSSGTAGGFNQQFAEYDLTGLNNVARQLSQNLDQINHSNIDGITIYQFQRDFNTVDPDDFVFTGTEQYLNIFAAVGTSGKILTSHGENNFFRDTDILLTPSPNASDSKWCDQTSLQLTECWYQVMDTATTISSTTISSTAKGCNKQDLVPATTRMNDFTVTFFINCDNDKVTVIIKYNDYNNNWFGVVFADEMKGPALVYTTGKSNDQEIGLYPYNLNGKDSSQVILDTENFWEKINETINENAIIVTYRQDLNNTEWSRETERVSMRWAYGTSLILEQHDIDTRSDNIAILNLLSGQVIVEKEDMSLEIVHGVLMWITWAFLASIGIFSSAFRDLLPLCGPIWFKIHRGIQATVVVIDLIGFIIAIIFTVQKDNPHFVNAHMIIGLIVTIFAILQPINAWFRAHPPENGWPNNKKPIQRIIWEWIHKGFGYITWILACITIMLGLLLINQQLLAYLHIFLWCSLLLITYIILKIVICLRSRQIDEIGDINAINEETSALPDN